MASPSRLRAVVRIAALVAAFAMPPVSAAYAAGGMLTGGLTSQPIGHYEFCRRAPSECSTRSADPGPSVMTKSLWKAIVGVNLAVNRAVRPMSDRDIHGREEVWSFPAAGVGDCEDYVLEKRRRLMAGGMPVANLLITVVRKQDGEGHAVLTIRTDKGDYVLDNLNDAVRPWQKTGYRFLKRQASEHTGRWVSIRGEQNPMVSSVR